MLGYKINKKPLTIFFGTLAVLLFIGFIMMALGKPFAGTATIIVGIVLFSSIMTVIITSVGDTRFEQLVADLVAEKPELLKKLEELRNIQD